jgi:hypothetical protein
MQQEPSSVSLGMMRRNSDTKHPNENDLCTISATAAVRYLDLAS